jgi:hypothetical protein
MDEINQSFLAQVIILHTCGQVQRERGGVNVKLFSAGMQYCTDLMVAIACAQTVPTETAWSIKTKGKPVVKPR